MESHFFFDTSAIVKRYMPKIGNAWVQTIEPPAQNELYASGDHYLLYLTLRKLGFRPSSDAMEIYQMAEQILAEGWDE